DHGPERHGVRLAAIDRFEADRVTGVHRECVGEVRRGLEVERAALVVDLHVVSGRGGSGATPATAGCACGDDECDECEGCDESRGHPILLMFSLGRGSFAASYVFRFLLLVSASGAVTVSRACDRSRYVARRSPQGPRTRRG